MPTLEDLRATVDVVAAHVADAYFRLEFPFYEEETTAFARLPGAHPDLAQRLAALYGAQLEANNDGGKAAVLICCALLQATIERLPTERCANLPTAIDLACGKAAESVTQFARRLNSVAGAVRAATSAAGGNAELGKAMVHALEMAGREGEVSIEVAPPEHAPGCYPEENAERSTKAFHVTLWVRGATTAETNALHSRGCNTLHATIGAFSTGVVPGGGVAYFLAADALRDKCDTDTITGLAATAVCAALEAPLRVRADTHFDGVRAALELEPQQALHNERWLVPVDDGPIDPTRIVQGAIREAGRAAADLLRAVL